MSAGDLTGVEMLRTVVCSTPSWPTHYAEIWTIGRLRLVICQRCALHRAVSDYEMWLYTQPADVVAPGCGKTVAPPTETEVS